MLRMASGANFLVRIRGRVRVMTAYAILVGSWSVRNMLDAILVALDASILVRKRTVDLVTSGASLVGLRAAG